MQSLKCYILLFIIMPLGKCYAQNGGSSIFKFLNIPNSAKMAALGGTFPTTNDRDISLSFKNPALIKAEDKGVIALNYSNYVADINYGSLQYGLKLKNSDVISTSIAFIDYGKFNETDVSGNETGATFTGADYLFNIGYGQNYQKKIYYGANVKAIYGSYDIYRSFALATDLSLTYRDTTADFSGGIIFQNIGTQLKAFDNRKEHLPFDITLSISKKLKYAPFRYHISYTNLQQFNLSYSDPNNPENEIDLITGDPINNKNNFTDKLSRHFIFATEFLLSPVLNLQIGYNIERSKELSITGSNGMAGFSYGFSLQLKRMSIAYANSRLNVAGANNYFSIQLQPSFLVAKKE